MRATAARTQRVDGTGRRAAGVRPTIAAGRARPCGEAGFSLIELVLVILILGLAVLPLVQQMAVSSKHAADGWSTTAATFLARERLEQVQADRNAASRGYAWITGANYPAEASLPGYAGFARTTTVSAESTYQAVAYKTITVSVTSSASPAVTLTGWVVN